MELSAIVEQNSASIKELSKLVHELSIETKVFIAHQTQINETFRKDYKESSSFEKKIKEKLDKLEATLKLRQTLTETVSKNWWKIIACLLPILGGLGELMVYLRNLPTSTN